MKQFWSIFFFMAGMWLAAEAQAAPPNRFVLTTGLTYATEYLTDGFRVGDASPVFQLSLKLDIPKTGFSLMYWDSIRADRSKREFDEHDFLGIYNHDFNQGSRYGFNFHGYYDYWFFPNSRPLTDPFGDQLSNTEMHGSKLNAGFSMTHLLPLAGSFLIPAYNVYYWIYWREDRSNQYEGGARHELSLSYSHLLPKLAAWMESQYAGAFASLNYNDGAFDVHPGLSHSVGTLYAGLVALNTDFIISANQQLSYQRTVNEQSDFWMTFTVLKEF
jgi:hypothetical protein